MLHLLCAGYYYHRDSEGETRTTTKETNMAKLIDVPCLMMPLDNQPHHAMPSKYAHYTLYFHKMSHVFAYSVVIVLLGHPVLVTL